MEIQKKENLDSTENSSLESQWLSTTDPEVFIKNNQTFNTLMMRYRCAILELHTRLDVLNDEFSVANKRNPISSIKSRIKSPGSIYEKLRRRGFEFTEENIITQLDDVAGVRVICPFVSDVYTIVELIKSQKDLTIIKEKDYIKVPKDNGYRSCHLIVDVPIFFSSGIHKMRAEIQIRTIGMDLWASVDHQLHYKKNLGMNENVAFIEQELLRAAEAVHQNDKHMEEIKSLIGQFEDTQLF